MLWWLFVLALCYASARWTAVSVVVRVFVLGFSVVGLLTMLQTGYIPVFLKAVFEIPLLFLQAIFGIIAAMISPITTTSRFLAVLLTATQIEEPPTS